MCYLFKLTYQVIEKILFTYKSNLLFLIKLYKILKSGSTFEESYTKLKNI